RIPLRGRAVPDHHHARPRWPRDRVEDRIDPVRRARRPDRHDRDGEGTYPVPGRGPDRDLPGEAEEALPGRRRRLTRRPRLRREGPSDPAPGLLLSMATGSMDRARAWSAAPAPRQLSPA